MPCCSQFRVQRGCGVWRTTFAALVLLAGCQALPVPSARFPVAPLESLAPTPARPLAGELPALISDPEEPQVAVQTDRSQETDWAETAILADAQASEPTPAQSQPDSPTVDEPLDEYPAARLSQVAVSDRSAQEQDSPENDQPPAPALKFKSPSTATPSLHHTTASSSFPKQGRSPSDHPECHDAGPACADQAALCGLCGTTPCPPLFVLPKPRCNLRCYLGPLFYHDIPERAAEMAEAELQVPHSLFHPVPTAPVFETRSTYEPPQLMMTPVEMPPRLLPHVAPRPLPVAGQPGLLKPLPEPTGDPSSDDGRGRPIPPPTNAETSPKSAPSVGSKGTYSPSAQRLESVLKRK